MLFINIIYFYKAAIMVPSHGPSHGRHKREAFVRFYIMFCKISLPALTLTCYSYYFVVRSRYLSHQNIK